MTSMEAAHRVYLGLGFTRDPALDWSPVPGVDLVAFRLTSRSDRGADGCRSDLHRDRRRHCRSDGIGSLPVLGTPRLLAWCEAATCSAIAPLLEAGETSVGTRVELEHTRGSRVGARLEVTASSVFRDGRLHRFSVVARQADDARVVATGEVTRVVVDAERFLGRL
jgi:predicted thioesterase